MALSPAIVPKLNALFRGFRRAVALLVAVVAAFLFATVTRKRQRFSGYSPSSWSCLFGGVDDSDSVWRH